MSRRCNELLHVPYLQLDGHTDTKYELSLPYLTLPTLLSEGL